MERPLGFSTGSLAPGDIAWAVAMLRDQPVTALELSSLRAAELANLLDGLPSLDLARFTYCSVHAPSRFVDLSEEQVIQQLRPVLERGWPIILHPDAVQHWDLWAEFGVQICLENMDGRKKFGNTVADLDSVFRQLPLASFCFDIGHARQIDPTMAFAKELLQRFGPRLRQVHLSEVNAWGGHELLRPDLVTSFALVAELIAPHTPVILETPANPNQIPEQLRLARQIFSGTADFSQHSR
jgi:hypothetical protein